MQALHPGFSHLTIGVGLGSLSQPLGRYKVAETKKGTNSHLSSDMGKPISESRYKQVPHGLEWRSPVERYRFFSRQPVFMISHILLAVKT
jgi:hypothetical protein